MEKIIGKYETIFVINPEYSEEATKALIEKFTGIITNNGGTIDSIDEWGKRKLAYPIEDLAEGYYVLVNFEAPKEVPAELDRVYNITDGILRSIIVALEK